MHEGPRGVRRAWWIAIVVGCGTEPVVDHDADSVPPPPSAPLWGVPISGGTMLATRDGNRAVIADPDRDRIVIVDLTTEAVAQTIALPSGSEPGRLVEDGQGRIHIALRRSGELLTLTDPQVRRPICGEPRGLAWDASTDLIHVACATGELVSVPAAGGDPVRVLRLDRDLRDVIVRDRSLLVSTFRTAELLEVSDSGRVSARVTLPTTQRIDATGEPFAPTDAGAPPKVDAIAEVAWRTIALPDGRVLVAHQRKINSALESRSGGYSAGCNSGPVESALTVVDARNRPFAVTPLIAGALPVDVAIHPGGEIIAVATAGDHGVTQIGAFHLTEPDDKDCGAGTGFSCNGCILSEGVDDSQLGAPTSVAYRPNGNLLVFYPERPALVIHGVTKRVVDLGGEAGYDRARNLFHAQTTLQLACASCHPEAREDGQVWSFAEFGPRRTLPLGGGILHRAPYHWSGDMANLGTLLDQVLTTRMAGPFVDATTASALGDWLDRIPAAKGVILDTAAVERGRTLFTSQELGCTTCHATLDRLVDVGTGGVFKVPSLLGVGARAPYLHNGCAATLEDRFGACGGGDLHGHTSLLSPAQRADLISYLQAL